MAASYKHSAWFYDTLSRVVYGKALVNAQVYLLQFIQCNSKILIVGGGTGWILEECTKIHSSGLKITYVEVAPDMMRLSKKRNIGDNKVTFICNAIEQTVLFEQFDVVIAPFLFDNFTEPTFEIIFNHIQKIMKPDGLWLVTDFRLTGKWWQSILLKTMFVFFKLICRIEASKLPDIEWRFYKNGYRVIEQQAFFRDFIVSTVYSNINNSTEINE